MSRKLILTLQVVGLVVCILVAPYCLLGGLFAVFDPKFTRQGMILLGLGALAAVAMVLIIWSMALGAKSAQSPPRDRE